MNLELYIEHIEAYEGKTLPEAERIQFEEALQSDAELQAAYELYRQADEAIEWQIGESLREQMQNWAREEQTVARPEKQGRVVAFRQIRRAAAAALVLLLGLWFVFDRGGSRPDNAELFVAYYVAPDASGLRGIAAADNPLKAGLALIEAGKGQEAYEYFESLLVASPDNVEYRYYQGHAAMLSKNWAIADGVFAQVESAAPETLAQKAAWNRALICLAEGKIPELKTRLEAIRQDSDHGYFTQAGELLEKLGR